MLKAFCATGLGVRDLAWRKALTAELSPKGRLQLLLKAFCATGLGVRDLAWREGLTAELRPKGRLQLLLLKK